jgi:ribosomal protein S18 acetylase RimI-like enzyme
VNVVNEVISRLLTVRQVERTDLPRLLHLEKHPEITRWIQHDHFRSAERGICVAAVPILVVGYLAYEIIPDTEDGGSAVRPPRRVRTKKAPPKPCRIALQHLYVAPDWRRRGVGRLLVERFAFQALKSTDYNLEAAVAESDLPMQLLLRSAGFRATRILHDHQCDEDAYLMERRVTVR